jgi:hypothetical protein
LLAPRKKGGFALVSKRRQVRCCVGSFYSRGSGDGSGGGSGGSGRRRRRRRRKKGRWVGFLV